LAEAPQFYWRRWWDGRYAGRYIALDEAFYSPIVSAELQSGRYPQLAQWWDYGAKATVVEGWDVEHLADEAHRLAAAYRVRSRDADIKPDHLVDAVQRNLDELDDFLWVANENGFDIFISPP
jgi:hypothetical protein